MCTLFFIVRLYTYKYGWKFVVGLKIAVSIIENTRRSGM